MNGSRRRCGWMGAWIAAWLAAGATAAAPSAGPSVDPLNGPEPSSEATPDPRPAGRRAMILAARAVDLYNARQFEQADAVLRELLVLQPDSFVARYNLACVRAAMNDPEGALEYLESAIEHGFSDRRLLDRDPSLDPIRQTPRFRAILDAWPRILELGLEANLRAQRAQFPSVRTTLRDPELRLAVLSAFDETSTVRALDDLRRVARWAASIMPGILDAHENAREAWVVVVLPDQRDFKRWVVRTYGPEMLRAGSTVGGAYQHDVRRLVAMDLGPTLRHEFAHVLHWRHMERLNQQHPIWIMEGLCSLPEDFDPAAPAGAAAPAPDVPAPDVVPAPSWRSNIVQRLARTGRLMRLQDLTSMSAVRFTGQRPLANYAIARTVFLWLSDQGLLADWYRLYTTDPTLGYAADPTGLKALQATLGTPADQLDRAFRDWLRALETVPERVRTGSASLGVEVDAGQGEGPVVLEPNHRLGLRRGDVLTAIDGRPVRDLAELVRILGDFNPGDQVSLAFRRRHQHHQTTATLIPAP